MSKITDSFKYPTIHSDEELISLLEHSDKQFHDGKAKVTSEAGSNRIGIAKGKLPSPENLDMDSAKIADSFEKLND